MYPRKSDIARRRPSLVSGTGASRDEIAARKAAAGKDHLLVVSFGFALEPAVLLEPGLAVRNEKRDQTW